MVRYFDANCHLGRFNYWSGNQPVTPEQLLAVMDHHGIHEALVVDSLSRESHPLDGNPRILDLVAGQPRLHPAWAALPPRSHELPPSQELVAQMEEQGVRALFLYPNQCHFTLDDWCVDALLGPLARRRVPLFICPSGLIRGSGCDESDWAGVVRICRAFPELPVVVVEDRNFKTLRPMYQALDGNPNLHVELSGLLYHRIVEFICREWGAERLLFGTALPVRDPAATLGQLNFSEISVTNLAAIAGGNLRRLLSWTRTPVPEPAATFPEPIDGLHAIVREHGSLYGQGFLCGHGHLGHHHSLHVVDNTLPQLVAELRRFGIERNIVFANSGINSDEVFGNDCVLEAMRQYPEQFIGFAVINAHRTPEAMRREMERCFALGVRGVKLHPGFQGYDPNSDRVEVPCAFAHEHRAFILNHWWGSAERLLYLCRKYPAACFITGHTDLEALTIAHQVDNLYVGTCPTWDFDIVERIYQMGAADRLVFGSDLSWASIGWGIGPILSARIPLESKRLILGETLRRLLQHYGSYRAE